MIARREAHKGRSVVDSLVSSLPPLTLVVGKGGVGKTTLAVGIAERLAAPETSVLLLSTDPAGALAGVLDVPLGGGDPRDVPGMPGLVAQQLDADRARRGFLARWRDTLVTILDRGTYLDAGDIDGLVDAAFPGADEIFAVLALAELVTSVSADGDRAAHVGGTVSRVVVDTAPTGHTLRLLALPETFEAMVALLETMQAKHRFMVRALTRRYRPDGADAFLTEMRAAMGTLRAALTDRRRAATVLVARAEPVVVAETARYADALRRMGVAIAALVVNGIADDAATQAALAELGEIAADAPCFVVPVLDPPPRGLQDVDRVWRGLRRLPRKVGAGLKRRERKGVRTRGAKDASLVLGGAPRAAGRPHRRPRSPTSLLRTLTICGGKGGVGKTSVSCALAIAAAEASSAPLLLVSTDPAPSIADALGIDDPHWARAGPQPVIGVVSLEAWQMDAALAFAELRERYQQRIDALFEAILGRGVDVAHDRAILRELLALAPPGVDELYALASLGEALEDHRYGHIIVDPAPTGHLLRLLEMPALALEWTHRLMRLMLKYKDVGGLGDAAQELVAFSKHTRVIDTLLHDPAQAGVLLVTLDEPVVRAESLRLADALRAARVEIVGVVENRQPARASAAPALLDRSLPHFAAPTATAPFVGVAAMRSWFAHWRAIGAV